MSPTEVLATISEGNLGQASTPRDTSAGFQNDHLAKQQRYVGPSNIMEQASLEQIYPTRTSAVASPYIPVEARQKRNTNHPTGHHSPPDHHSEARVLPPAGTN